jgi:hypothetical protein
LFVYFLFFVFILCFLFVGGYFFYFRSFFFINFFLQHLLIYLGAIVSWLNELNCWNCLVWLCDWDLSILRRKKNGSKPSVFMIRIFYSLLCSRFQMQFCPLSIPLILKIKKRFISKILSTNTILCKLMLINLTHLKIKLWFWFDMIWCYSSMKNMFWFYQDLSFLYYFFFHGSDAKSYLL